MIPHNEIEEELLFHLEARAAHLRQQGMDEQQAWRKARLEMGAVSRYVEEGREAREIPGAGWTRRLAAAVARQLHRARGFSFAACLAIALGVGVATFAFSTGKRVLLEPVPYPDAYRLFNVRAVAPQFQEIHRTLPVSPRLISAVRNGCPACEALLVMDSAVYQASGRAGRLMGLGVTDGFAGITGAKVQLGRMFSEQEFHGPARVALLTDTGWRQHFGGASDVVGQVLELNGVRTQIIGVLDAGLLLPRGEQLGEMVPFGPDSDLVIPMELASRSKLADEDFLWAMILKLHPGSSAASAQRQITQTASGLRAELTPLGEQLSSTSGQALWLLMGGAGLLLVVVALNFANLQLVRLTAAARDMTIRSALGATHGDLIAHACGEIATLGLTGGVLGAGFAWLAMVLLDRWQPLFLPGSRDLQPDLLVWLGVVGVVLAAGGCAVWIWSHWPNPKRSLFLFAGVALSVTLASAAGLMEVSYRKWIDTDRGFAAEAMWAFCARLPEGVPQPEFTRRKQQLLNALRAEPSIAAMGAANRIPLQGEATIDPLRVEGRAAGAMASWRAVGPGYFEASGTRILEGRGFADGDEPTVVLSERVAREFSIGIGAKLQVSVPEGAVWAEVVGIAEDATSKRIDSRTPMLVYVNDAIFPQRESFFVVRMRDTAGDPVAAIRKQVEAAGLMLPQDRVLPMRSVLEDVATPRRLPVVWLICAAAIGLLATALGVFSLVHFEAGRRVLELGVSLALGATRTQAAARLLRKLLPVIGAGLATGALLALLVIAALGTLVAHGIQVVVFSVAAVGSASILAAAIPALRAVQMDPTITLRNR